MAIDATGTPTTNYGLPTYNINADAPSGNGFNAFATAADASMKTIDNKAVAAQNTANAKPGIGIVIAMGS